MRTRSAHPDDLPDLRYVVSRAFGVPEESTVDRWVEQGGYDQWRVLEVEGRVRACAVRIPMGHFYGGRSVPMLGLAGVATAPEARGRRVGAALVRDVLTEARAEGFGLSTLYPSTREFYQGLGYELAGDHATIVCDIHRLPRGAPADEIVRVETDAERDEVRALYARTAPLCDGALDRGPYVWSRVLASLRFRMDVYLLRCGGETVAAAAILLPSSGDFYDVKMYDWAYADPRGLQALLHFLRGYRALADRVEYTGSVADAFTAALPARSYEAKLEEPYLMRLLDPVVALTRRGYPFHVQTELTIAITEDPVCPDDVATYRLRVADGVGEVLRLPAGTKADLTGTIRGVSALYAPYMPATQLARMGWLQGEAEALRRAEQIFGLRRPYLAEMF